MKKINLISAAVLLFSFLFIIGCRKENSQSKAGTDLTSAKNEKPKNECRLTELIAGPLGSYQYRYNTAGLNSEWDISGYGTFKQEYDANGRLIKSRWFIDDELIVTIEFFFDNHGRSVHEIWYFGNTQDVYDEVFLTRDARGLITKMESIAGDYYTDVVYTPEGNTKEWHFYVGGQPFLSGYYQYIQTYRNPYLAIPGIEYGFPFLNPSINQQKWWATGEKITGYDENGNSFDIHDYDATQTQFLPTFQNYPSQANYFDLTSEAWHDYSFEYENCGPGNNLSRSSNSVSAAYTGKNGSGIMRFLQRHPNVPIKEHMKQLRNEFLRKAAN
jgi:hypothetical protein